MAVLLVDVLQHYRTEKKYKLHGFVVMPNHLHVLVTLTSEISVEKATQLIKGGFSFRAKREIGVKWPIWHRGFSEVRIFSEEAFRARQDYMHQNPVRARLVEQAEEWEYSSGSRRYQLDSCPEYLRG
jgi:putative transposase